MDDDEPIDDHVRQVAARLPFPVQLEADMGGTFVLQVLVDAGYSFRWHAGQHPLDQVDHLYGIPVGAA
jgi:hypothetical protein